MEEGGDLARMFFLFRRSFYFPESEGYGDLTILQSGISGKQPKLILRVANDHIYYNPLNNQNF